MKFYDNEDELSKAMGDAYHVCHKCMVYNTILDRVLCKLSQTNNIKESTDYRLKIFDNLIKELIIYG